MDVDADDGGLAEAYWTFHRLASGSREERTRVDDLFWAYNRVNDLVADDPTAAIAVIDQLLTSPHAEVDTIAFGPIEDPLVLHPPWCAEHLPTKCRVEPRGGPS